MIHVPTIYVIETKLDLFLCDFPKDSTTWENAGQEIDDIYRWFESEPIAWEPLDTPSKWNTAFVDAIKREFKKLDYFGKVKFYKDNIDFLSPEEENDL